MATNSASEIAEVTPTGSQRPSATESESEREEPGFQHEESASPRARPPMPPPRNASNSRRSTRISRRSATGTTGTYQLVPDSNPDTHHNQAYGTVDPVDNQRPGSQQEQDEAADYESPLLSRDKVFGISMKKYILISLGLVNIPGTSVSCAWLAVLFYIVLAAWGVGILSTATQTVFTTLAEEDCHNMLPAFILAMVAGTFFVLVGFYWILAFWWTKLSSSASRKISFTFLAFLWLILALLFIGIAAALATEVYEHSDKLANFTAEIACKDDGIGQELPYHYNIIPLLALVSMIFLWMVYVCLFIINALCNRK